MSELIEGLLSLAHLSREQIRSEQVDLSAIARRIEQDLREREPERQVQVHIQDGLSAHGDPRLLAAVLQNLLGNAWKFTSRQTLARIDVVSELEANGDTLFFVKDNGAGFDMAFVSKLFGTFERLHAPEDFAGTGIGLATVKRVIERHGGRVWADGKLNEGATFYFTLGSTASAQTEGRSPPDA
jgi:light-regulated signal transduction histidine kinase (bacteriophytochrome)